VTFEALSPAVQRIVRLIVVDGWTAEALDVMTDLRPADVEAAVAFVDEHPSFALGRQS
jgi:hypothetical protein